MPPRTPLVRPDRFFAERAIYGGRVLALVILHVFSLPLAVWGVGQVLQARIDGTVLVQNPNRPSEQFCEGAPTSMDMCDAPAHVERNIDTLLADQAGELLAPALLGIGSVIVLVGSALHVGAWLFDGSSGFGTSFTVALWGLVPLLFSLLAGIALLYVFLDPSTVTPESDPVVLAERVQAALVPVQQVQPLLTTVTALWSGLIWRFGLQHKQGLTSGTATATAGAVVGLIWLLSLA